jgi:tetratricopeptide (TPR) repeat protein
MQSLFETFEQHSRRGLDITRIVGLESTSKPEMNSFEVRCGEMMAEIAAHVHACIKQAGLTGPELDGSHPIERHFAAFLQRSDLPAAAEIWGRILQRSITMYGPLDERTLEAMRLMLRKGAQLILVEARFKVMDALHQTYGSEHPDYMVALSEMIELYSFTIKEPGGEALLRGVVTELKGAVDRVDLDHKTTSIQVALKLCWGMTILGEMDAAQLLLDRASAALPTEEEGEEISSVIQLYKVVRVSLLKRSGKYEELRKVAESYIEEEERCQNESNPEIILSLRSLLADSYAIQGRWKDAAAVCEVSLTYCNRTLGPSELLTQHLGILLACYYIQDNPDNVEASIEKIRKIIKLQREFGGNRCKKTLNLEWLAAMAYKSVGQHRLSFELHKESYLRYRQWLPRADGNRLNLENDYAMSLTTVPDRTASEIADISDMLKDRISFFEGKHESSLTKLKLAEFLYAVKYYEKVLELLGTTIQLRKRNHKVTMSDKACRERTLIASCYRLLRRWDEAMSWYCDIVESQKNDGGKVNDELALNLVYYAHACFHAKNWTKAEEVYQEILEFRINAYGQHHSKTIIAMEWLAQNYKKAQLFPMAAAQFQQILIAKQSIYGEDDKRIIVTLNEFADMTFSQRTAAKFGEAEINFRRVVHLRTLHDGAESKGVCTAKTCVANCLLELGRYPEAILLLQDTLDWHEKNYGSESQSAIKCLEDIAVAYLRSSDFIKVLDPMSRVITWRTVGLGKDHYETLRAVQQLGNAHLGLKQFVTALPYLIEAADGYMALEPRPAPTVAVLNQVANVAKLLNHWTMVEKYRLCILKCMEDTQQPTPMRSILHQRYIVGIARLHQGRAAEAEPDIAKALEVNRQEDPSSLSTALSCYWYAESQTLLEKHDNAAENYAMFVSYQMVTPTGEEELYATWGRGWAAFQQRAWEQLESFHSKTTEAAETKTFYESTLTKAPVIVATLSG